MKLVDFYYDKQIPDVDAFDPDKERQLLNDTKADWTISLLYRLFFVPENVVKHMNRVALVLMVLLRQLPPRSVSHEKMTQLILAAQTHDMANIVKFEKFLPPLARDEFKWRIVQEYIKSVWADSERPNNEHLATMRMLDFVGIDEDVQQIISATDHARISPDFTIEELLLWYADMRVALRRVTTFKERLKDTINRYPRPTIDQDNYDERVKNWDRIFALNITLSAQIAVMVKVSVKQLRRLVRKYESEYPDPHALADAIPKIFQELFPEDELAVQAE